MQRFFSLLNFWWNQLRPINIILFHKYLVLFYSVLSIQFDTKFEINYLLFAFIQLENEVSLLMREYNCTDF